MQELGCLDYHNFIANVITKTRTFRVKLSIVVVLDLRKCLHAMYIQHYG